MNRITHFSKHALERLEQRSSLTYYELARILDCNVFENVGRVPGFNKEHRLFFSKKDELFYVAIQDIHTGTVVTVLPPDYYENLYGKITEEQFIAARSLAASPPEAFENYDSVSSTTTPPSSFFVSVSYIDIEGLQKTKAVLSEAASPYNFDIGEFVGNSLFEADLCRAMLKKGVEPNSIFLVSIRLGRKGDLIFFDWQNGSLA